jgi:hypothetical protein
MIFGAMHHNPPLWGTADILPVPEGSDAAYNPDRNSAGVQRNPRRDAALKSGDL